MSMLGDSEQHTHCSELSFLTCGMELMMFVGTESFKVDWSIIKQKSARLSIINIILFDIVPAIILSAIALYKWRH